MEPKAGFLSPVPPFALAYPAPLDTQGKNISFLLVSHFTDETSDA